MKIRARYVAPAVLGVIGARLSILTYTLLLSGLLVLAVLVTLIRDRYR